MKEDTGSLDAMMAPGVTVRIGDQDLVIDEVNGDIAWFTPTTHGCTECDVLLENFIGTGNLATTSTPTTVAITTQGTQDITKELQTGDAYMIKDKTGSQIQVGFSSLSSSLLTASAAITVVDSIDTVASTNNYKVAIYRMKAAMVPVDASPGEMKSALESMNAMGTVDVTRYGPTIEDGYTWSVTYTSAYGTTHTCTGLGSDNDCLVTSDAASSTYNFANCAGDYAELNGDYVSHSYESGRKVYYGPVDTNGVMGPFVLRYDDSTTKFGVYLNTAAENMHLILEEDDPSGEDSRTWSQNCDGSIETSATTLATPIPRPGLLSSRRAWLLLSTMWLPAAR